MSANMMKHWRILIVVIAALFTMNCSDDEPGRTGTYRYTASHSGTPVVEGLLHLDEITITRVTGRWELSRVGSTNVEVGPQVGTGTLAGSFDGAVLSIDMNPGFADNNVFLTGTFQGNTLRGEWSFTGFPGPISGGTFVAEH
jgi:hypothetical protein